MDQLTIATHDQKLQMWISRIQECKASGITVNVNSTNNEDSVQKVITIFCQKI